jgi:predicted metalloprotease with PDZ domain
VIDAIPGMAAAKAGVAPGMKVVAVRGRKWSPKIAHEAIKESKGAKGPIDLLVENGDYYSTLRVDWRGGERYPHLVRDGAKADLLAAIWAPLLGPPATPVK